MSFLSDTLKSLEAQNLLRKTQVSQKPGRHISIQGFSAINFSSNNYLGLANHPSLVKASIEALNTYGTGSTASRLVTGTLPLHQQLERKLALFHGVESVCLFNSGYQANLGLLSSIAGKQDIIFSDQLNHASIIDGTRLSKAKVKIYEHLDIDALEKQLKEAKSYQGRFIVSDGVFSMDGDLAPVVALANLCHAHNAFLIVDEAHALGVLGLGRGLCHENKVTADAMVGGLGKSFGSCGGYVAGSAELVLYLVNMARSYIFSTSLPAATLAASIAAVDLLTSDEGQQRIATLRKRVNQFALGLKSINKLEEKAGSSAIFPILADSTLKALQWSETLLRNGAFCQAIRPPTVPPGGSRLRIALSAMHTEEDIDLLLNFVDQLA